MARPPIPPEQLEIWQDEADEPRASDYAVTGAILFALVSLLVVGASQVVSWVFL